MHVGRQSTQALNMAELMSPILLLLVIARTSAADIVSPLTYSTDEEQPSTMLGNVAQDSGLHSMYAEAVMAKMTFSFPDQVAEYLDLFAVDNGGILRTAGKVDREVFCSGQASCVLPLNIQAQSEEYFHIIKVDVNIEDINDNRPTFPEDPVSISLSEASVVDSMFPIPAAADPDSPDFGVQRYQLISNTNDFEVEYVPDVDRENIYIAVKGKLDRETRAYYSMQVVAVDGTGLSSSVDVNIEVTDVNDNSPHFLNQSYAMSVYENRDPPVNLLQVTATDPDAGESGKVIYGFSSKTEKEFSELFSIDATTGEITLVGNLNYGTASSYSLTVTARDSSEGSLPDLAQVMINVLDVNDHAPLIRLNTATDDEGRVHVSEAKVSGSFVAHISVSDEDFGDNQLFDCNLQDTHFALEQLHDTDFKVVTKDALDRENKAEHDLIVLCEDHGSPAQASTKHITVMLDDVNDNAPQFEEPVYEITVEENSEELFLVQVQAQDADSGPNAQLTYRVDEAVSSIIQVAALSGKVYAKDTLDHEATPQLVFQVVAIDGSEEPLSSTTTVIINVVDLDDEKPEFTKPVFVFEVDENAPEKTEVDQVVAVDADSSLYNDFVYGFDETQSNNGPFSISPESGTIYTEAILDRESQGIYSLVVLAKSVEPLRPVTSTAIVTISVRDLNDNVPMIEFPDPVNNTVSVPHITQPGDFASQIEAVDADEPGSPNSKLTYVMVSGNEDGYFRINSTTGVISAAKKLHSMAEELFAFVISVKDNGVPARKVEATLNIFVNKADSESQVSDTNLTVVVIVGCVAGVIMVVLLVTIVTLIRRHQQRKEQKKRTFLEVIVEQKSRCNNDAFVGIADERMGKMGLENQASSTNDRELNYNNHNQATAAQNATSRIPSQPQPVPSSSSVPSYCDPSRYKLIYGSAAVPNNKRSELTNAGMQSTVADKDSDSGCCADISHGHDSTDSGRGSQQEVHSPFCSPSKWHHQNNLLVHTPPSSPILKPCTPREYRHPPPYPGHMTTGLPQFDVPRPSSKMQGAPDPPVYFIGSVKQIREVHV